jgi:predicted transporter
MKIFILWIIFIAAIYIKQFFAKKDWKAAKHKSILLTIMFVILSGIFAIIPGF